MAWSLVLMFVLQGEYSRQLSLVQFLFTRITCNVLYRYLFNLQQLWFLHGEATMGEIGIVGIVSNLA
jgi:hypothetical protein